MANVQVLSLRNRLMLQVAVFCVALGAIALASYNALEQFKVGGPRYKQIVITKDLLADVLPPPQTLLEAYLLTLQMSQETDEQKLESMARKLSDFQLEYERTHQIWVGAPLPENIKHRIIVSAYNPAVEFFEICKSDFLPAVRAKNAEKTLSLVRGILQSKYEEHRKAIDDLVPILSSASSVDERKVGDDVASAMRAQLWLALAGLLVPATIAFFLTRGILSCVAELTRAAQGMVAGEYIKIEYDAKDEIGQMVVAFQKLAEAQQAKADSAVHIAAGDLSVDVRAQSDKDALGKSLQLMVANLRRLIGEVNEAANQVTAGADQINSASQALSAGATEQASSIEQISSSMTQIRSLTKNTADNAAQASKLTGAARDMAENGNKQMKTLVFSIGEISASSQEISKIIKVIDDIAFQTNLLALNAAVEAARAGRHGKGFAVVAEEVRNLASRSAKAARATSDLIEASNAKVENGLSVVENAAKALTEIVNHVVQAAKIAGDIAVASDEQARGIAQIAEGLTQIDRVTEQNTSNSEETAAAAEELAGQAAHLQHLLSRFKLGIAEARQNQSEGRTEVRSPIHQSGAAKTGRHAPVLKTSLTRPEDVIALDDKEFGKY